MTLYLKLGGRNAINRALPQLEVRLEGDPCFDLSDYNGGFDPTGDLAEFLVFLVGGAPVYDGAPICELLSPLCNCNDIYDRFVDHLVAVLFDADPRSDDGEELRQLMSRLRPLVVDPRPVAPEPTYTIEAQPAFA